MRSWPLELASGGPEANSSPVRSLFEPTYAATMGKKERMASDAANQLVDLWLNDPGFKERMLADPETAIRQSGLTLSDEDWAAVRTVAAGLGDEELTTRISKSAGFNN